MSDRLGSNPARRYAARSGTSAALTGSVVALTVATLLTGCSSAASSHAAAQASAAPRASVPAAPSALSLNSRAQAAEGVQAVLGPRVTADEDRYGSGTGSPCAISSVELFTPHCGRVAAAVDADATLALSAIKGRTGFATLNKTAHALLADVAAYRRRGCDGNPTADATRHACLAPAAAIAQAFPDLRDGINLALTGQ